jgi:hypothetical protein
LAIGVAAVVAVAAIIWSVRGARQANPGIVKSPEFILPEPAEADSERGAVPRGLELSGPSVVQNDAEGNPVWSAKSEGEFTVEATGARVIGTDVLWKLVKGTEAVSVEAGRMELGWETGDVGFDKGVTVTTGPGRRFEAKQARYEASTEKMICDGGVTWQSERFRASAQTLVVDARDKKIRLRGEVRLTMTGRG